MAMEVKQDKLTIRVNGTECSYPKGSCYKEVADDFADQEKYPILLVKVNNRLQELYRNVEEGDEISFVTVQDRDGEKTYLRSLTLMMLRAIDRLYPGDPRYQLTVRFSVGGGQYCTLKDASCVDEAFLKAVKEEMETLCEQAVPIHKDVVRTSRAIQIFHEKGLFDKEQLFRFRLQSLTNLYELEGYQDYFYGYMVYDTSCLELFDLLPYDNGFVLMYPHRADPDSLPRFAPDVKLFHTQKASAAWGDTIGLSDVGNLNEQIVRGEGKEMILIQEAYHEKQIAQIAEQIAADPEKKIVMIAGPSSSGKTSFSHRLSTQLSIHGLRPHPVPVDDYFLNREDTPRDEDGNYDFECLEAIDIELFNHDMKALLNGERVEMPIFNFQSGKREYKGKYMQISKGDILVIEGIHGLNDNMSYALPKESKFKIYVSALTALNVDEHNRISTTDGRLLRRIVRDSRTRGTSAEGTINMWPSVGRGEKLNIFRYQESADVMFNSSLIYELSVLKVYAQPLLFGIGEDSPAAVEAKRLLKFLDYFVPLPAQDIPMNSLLREFVGGSCFNV